MTFLLAGIRWTQEAKAFRLRINCAQKTLIYDVAAWLGSTATYAILQPPPILHVEWRHLQRVALKSMLRKAGSSFLLAFSCDFLTTATAAAAHTAGAGIVRMRCLAGTV